MLLVKMNKNYPTWPASSREPAWQVENNHINRCWYWPLNSFWDYHSLCAAILFETLSFHTLQMPLYRVVFHLSLCLKILIIFYHHRRVLPGISCWRITIFFDFPSNSCQFIRRDKIVWSLVDTQSQFETLKVCVIRFNLVFSSHIGFFSLLFCISTTAVNFSSTACISAFSSSVFTMDDKAEKGKKSNLNNKHDGHLKNKHRLKWSGFTTL